MGIPKRLIRAAGLDFDQARWRPIIARDRELWERARREARGGTRVLIATSHGGHRPSTVVESLLAAALTLRGADAHVLLCDSALRACLMCSHVTFPDARDFVAEGPQKRLCWGCEPVGRRLYRPLGLPMHWLSEWLTPEDMERANALTASVPFEQISQHELDGVQVGEHALAGALRFYARATLEHEPHAEDVLRRYFHAALVTAFATRRLLTEQRYECVCFNHGIYVPQGLIGEVARSLGIRVVNWNPGYRKQRFIFSHGDTYHHTLMDEDTRSWQDLPWSPELEAETMQYLDSRRSGAQDWIQFLHEDAYEDLDRVATELGTTFDRPVVSLLTNVAWDAQLHYPANAFPNMLDWVLETVRYFATRPDLQLIIRVHPAELTGNLPSRQRVQDELAAAFDPLPPNVFVIPPESRISTYAVARISNAVLIYGTKTGVELTSLGIPVIVAGEAWIRNKGVTTDIGSPEEYRAVLARLPLAERMPQGQIERARKYAFHFFFRRMIPIRGIRASKFLNPYVLAVRSLREIVPGADPGLDVVCEGILTGAPFVYPAEREVATASPSLA